MSIFHQPLVNLAAESHQPIPPFLEKCFKFILEKAVDKVGIFRIPGNDRELKKMEEMLDKIGDIRLEETTNPFNVCNIITRFLRYIPGHVLIDDDSAKWYNAKTVEDMSKLVAQLPLLNRALLSRVLGFFSIVVQHTDKNRMNPKSIGIILSPNLIVDRENPTLLYPTQNIELLLNEYKNIFKKPFALDENGNFLSAEEYSNVVHYVPEFFFQTNTIHSNLFKAKKNESKKKKQKTISRQYLVINRIDPDTLMSELLSSSFTGSSSSLSPI